MNTHNPQNDIEAKVKKFIQSLPPSYSISSLEEDSYESLYIDVKDVERCFRTLLTEQATQQAGELQRRVGMLRQWLNEDRIADARNFVSNNELMFWLTGDESYLPPQPKD